MRRLVFLGPVVLVVFGLGLVFGAIGLIVAEAHGGDASLVHGCVNSSGRLRVVGASENCAGNEEALDWNIAGVPGSDGSDGTDGVSGYQIVTVSGETNGDQLKFEQAFCPEGKQALGGGVFPINIGYADFAVSYTSPFPPNGWRVAGTDNGAVPDDSWSIAAFVVCATVN